MADLTGTAEAVAQTCRNMADAYPESVFPAPAPEDRARDAVAAQVLRDVAAPHFDAAANIITELTAEIERLETENAKLRVVAEASDDVDRSIDYDTPLTDALDAWKDGA